MQHIGSSGARRDESKSETDIRKNSKIRTGIAVAAREPSVAGIEEHGCPQRRQLENLSVRIDAMLEGQQKTPISALKAQGIAAKPAVSPEQELLLGVQVLDRRSLQLSVESAAAGVSPEKANRTGKRRVLEALLGITRAARSGQKDEPPIADTLKPNNAWLLSAPKTGSETPNLADSVDPRLMSSVFAILSRSRSSTKRS